MEQPQLASTRANPHIRFNNSKKTNIWCLLPRHYVSAFVYLSFRFVCIWLLYSLSTSLSLLSRSLFSERNTTETQPSPAQPGMMGKSQKKKMMCVGLSLLLLIAVFQRCCLRTLDASSTLSAVPQLVQGKPYVPCEFRFGLPDSIWTANQKPTHVVRLSNFSTLWAHIDDNIRTAFAQCSRPIFTKNSSNSTQQEPPKKNQAIPASLQTWDHQSMRRCEQLIYADGYVTYEVSH